MIDHLIFDFDGTISDSYPIFVRIVRQVAKDFDVEVKMSDEELLDKLMVNVKHCMDHMNFQCELYERSQAFWSYIYTHSGDIVLDMLKNMGLDGYFSGIVTADHGFPQKPAPDALYYLCKTYGVDPSRSIMIGDRDIDTMSGNNAGMKGCLWDVNGRYTDYQTDYKVKTLLELNALLDEI